MISQQISQLTGSPILQFLKMAKQREAEGHQIIHLEVGQPDFQPLQSILESTVAAIHEGKTGYTLSSGIPELRQKISQYYQEDYDLGINPHKEINITSGTKLGILASFYAILDNGDHLLIPEPYWAAYPDIVRITGAKFIPISMKQDFSLNQDEILAKIERGKTKAIVINSPNNPSSHVLTRDELVFLKNLVEDENIFIISDEIYSDYYYIDAEFKTILSEFNDWRNNIIVVNGFAKTYSMTGYRLGWTLSNPDIADGILKVIQASTTCPTTFAQWGAITAIEQREEARKYINKVFPVRREVLLEEIDKIDGLSIGTIDGAFYGFIKYSFTNKSSQEVAEDILMKTNVCTIPGTAFGDSAENYLRVTFARSIEEIREAFKRISEYID
ncbi:MAG: pyridoxal phosphate-dependent aminotransferase [Promethearchaeota archaeon]